VIRLSDRMTQSVLSRRRGERLSLRTISHAEILRAKQGWELYRPRCYENLVFAFGWEMFHLSAGWGLIRSDFFTPDYNITSQVSRMLGLGGQTTHDTGS